MRCIFLAILEEDEFGDAFHCVDVGAKFGNGPRESQTTQHDDYFETIRSHFGLRGTSVQGNTVAVQSACCTASFRSPVPSVRTSFLLLVSSRPFCLHRRLMTRRAIPCLSRRRHLVLHFLVLLSVPFLTSTEWPPVSQQPRRISLKTWTVRYNQSVDFPN